MAMSRSTRELENSRTKMIDLCYELSCLVNLWMLSSGWHAVMHGEIERNAVCTERVISGMCGEVIAAVRCTLYGL